MKTVCVSGFFDPLHIGHLRHFELAKALGDKLIVVVSRDDQCIKKKGYYILPLEQRMAIIGALRCVDQVQMNIDTENISAETLALLKPDIFAKGGEYTKSNLPPEEIEVCKKFNIELVFGIGLALDSSQRLVKKAMEVSKDNRRER